MRRLVVAGTSLLLIAAVGVVLVGTAISASKRPDLAVSSLAEPMQAVAPGSTFRESFTLVNQGNRTARASRTRFFLDLKPSNSAGRRRVGTARSASIAGVSEINQRKTLRVPASLAPGSYFLVACADFGKKIKESRESNNCRHTGQAVAVGGSIRGPAGPAGENTETTIDRTTLPIGRATVPGFFNDSPPDDAPGDDEKSNQRKELAKVGPVSIVADCKRTTNGDSEEADDPFTNDNSFDLDGDEAKILVYTDSGTVTFNGPGNSSHRNIPPGEGETEGNDPGVGQTQADETNGGEGQHTAIATARDPDQEEPYNGTRPSPSGSAASTSRIRTEPSSISSHTPGSTCSAPRTSACSAAC